MGVQISNKITYFLCQQALLQISSKITDCLWAGNGRDAVSSGCAEIQQDHVLAVSGQWERRSQHVQDHVLAVVKQWEKLCQQVLLQISSKITDFLWASDGQDGVSR